METFIHIPTPCHENWNNMLPADQGRHCLQCSKTVVDFTDWDTPAIAAYLYANATQKVCGRFNATQLDVPVEDTILQVFYSSLPLFKKIAAVIVIVFGMASCSPKTTGEPMMGQMRMTDTIPAKITPLTGEVLIVAGQVQMKKVE
ncbi:hypothetical protein SAMN05428988_6417 [Chitinophaga sp. YR573]|uniref:hypothetical protein n=1 Tax=Chitinophaga sp. YR573 TaxID=1881040 RepID=UPI0008B89F13|nr:hypothetical protein [Chitinophaga sp. YR573]SEW46563.1 hypothetical protein SAMN05428988_6417 [Chitinophaga sp. YR573]